MITNIPPQNIVVSLDSGLPGPPGPPGQPGSPGPTVVSADPGNLARLGSDNLIYVPIHEPPVLISLSETDFTVVGTWYNIIPAMIFPLPVRPGNTLLQIAVSLHFIWTAVNNSQALCDWSLDGTTHFRRTFHTIVNKSDNSSVSGVDLVFWQIVSGTSPTVLLQGRQYTGPTLLSVVGLETTAWPALQSYALIVDMGPI
jgi:hypothetical protein